MLKTKITFSLTPTQRKLIQPLTDRMAKERGGILGQCWVVESDHRYGTADFYFLTEEQHSIVDKAIREAIKCPTE